MALRISLFLTCVVSAMAFFAYHYESGQAGGGSITVDTTADDNGTCDDGNCSLREAINLANSTSVDTISFSIGSGVQAIVLSSPLPALGSSVVIDGTSQPGFSSAPLIVIDGNALGSGDGLVLTGSDSINGLVICNFPGAGINISSGRDNIITNSYIGTDPSGNGAQPNGAGINVQTGNNIIGYPEAGNVISGNNGTGLSATGGVNTIQANKIGVNSSGNGGLGNSGVGLSVSGADNLIGGLQAGQGNVISGNSGDGLDLSNGDRTNVVGNKIGTNASGGSAIPNGGIGVNVNGGADVVVGGTQIEAANVVSANTKGIEIQHATNAKVDGNRIGTDVGGNADIGNNEEGVYIFQSTGTEVGNNQDGARNIISGNGGAGVSIESSSSSVISNNAIGAGASLGSLPNDRGVVVSGSEGDTHNNLIGGANFNAGNVIAFNNGAGLAILGGVGTMLRDNYIYSNGGLGIDINGDGVTPNDDNDGDNGPNHLQNYPVLNSALSGTMVLSGTIHGAPGTDFFMDLFISPSCDPSGYGEGQVYIGAISVFVGASGVATFAEVVDQAPLGQFVSAVATNVDNGDSSEFSNCVQITETPPPTPTASPTPPPAQNTPTNTPQPTNTPVATNTPQPQPSETPGESTPPAQTATPTRTATPVATASGLMGDVDCNHTVNSVDVALILQYSAGLVHSLNCQAGGDVSHDSHVNSIDSALILQYIAGLLHSLS